MRTHWAQKGPHIWTHGTHRSRRCGSWVQCTVVRRVESKRHTASAQLLSVWRVCDHGNVPYAVSIAATMPQATRETIRANNDIMLVHIKRPPEIALARALYFTRRVWGKILNEFIWLNPSYRSPRVTIPRYNRPCAEESYQLKILQSQ